MPRTVEHTFWCLNCGREGIPLPRKISHLHAPHHRKKMYCPWCKAVVNHLECKSQKDILDFKENFEARLYQEEAQESLEFIKQEENKCVKFYI